MEDGRCKLGLQGRVELVTLVENGATLRQAAACLSVAPATAHRWWHRWRAASQAERASRACLRDPFDAPAVVSVGLTAEAEQAILERAREDQLGADAAAVSLRPASLDDLEGAQASRRVAPAPQRASSDYAPL